MLSKKWIAAYQFTKEQGMNIPPLLSAQAQNKRYLSKAIADKTLLLLKEVYVGKPEDEFLVKCFDVHHAIYNILWDMNVPCYLTLGWVGFGEKRFFYQSEVDIRNWLKSGVPDVDDVSMHCWITLPSGEIVDATLLSVIARLGDEPARIGEILWADNESVNGLEYQPTLIGYEPLKRLGLSK